MTDGQDSKPVVSFTPEQTAEPIGPYTKIRYVQTGDLTIYLIPEDELRLLESGSPAGTLFSLAIFFLSVGLSFLVSLLLSEPKSNRIFVVITIITVAAVIAGIILLVLWLRSSKDAKSVLKRIRARGIVPTKAENPGS